MFYWLLIGSELSCVLFPEVFLLRYLGNLLAFLKFKGLSVRRFIEKEKTGWWWPETGENTLRKMSHSKYTFKNEQKQWVMFITYWPEGMMRRKIFLLQNYICTIFSDVRSHLQQDCYYLFSSMSLYCYLKLCMTRPWLDNPPHIQLVNGKVRICKQISLSLSFLKSVIFFPLKKISAHLVTRARNWARIFFQMWIFKISFYLIFYSEQHFSECLNLD